MSAFFQAILAFLAKTFQSRKFWAAVAASTPSAAAGDWHGFSLIWMAYAGIQGAVDGMAVLGAKKPVSINPPQAEAVPDGVPEALDPEITSPMDLPESAIKTHPPKEAE